MAAGDHLNKYAEGWTTGNVSTVMESLDASYEMDDPNAGTIPKAGFTEYFNGFKGVVAEMRGQESTPLIELSEVVTQQDGDNLTAWAWWVVPGTPIEGSGLIKVGPNGILSERLTFYTKLPEA
ncbi:MAG: nuclear transport factor 2 family protein [Chloroflexi bacterium]|nr:nuclear transport factor 2 family protein [Chloroflexota bacterium]